LDTFVERCGYAAAALTLLPLPGTELVGVTSVHVGMVVKIGAEHGHAVSRESALDLVKQIGTTVGASLVGSALATTAGKILLPGLGGLIAAPFAFAATLGIGHVARLYFERGELSRAEMKRAYEDAAQHAKTIFDPRRARSTEARAMAEEARREEERVAEAPKKSADVDELAERLAKLDELLDKGVISEAEHDRRREKILDEI
jgi:uncharacterized protein (DUF697 family)